MQEFKKRLWFELIPHVIVQQQCHSEKIDDRIKSNRIENQCLFVCKINGEKLCHTDNDITF